MPIKPNFNPNQIADYIQSRLKKVDEAIIYRLKYLGEELVNHAREYGSYVNHTGNLRNSIGYVIIKDGQIVVRNFQQTVRNSGVTGQKKSQELVNKLSLEFPKGYALVVVAGMNYAAKVESRGRNVLSTAEQMCKSEMPRMISELKLNIARMK